MADYFAHAFCLIGLTDRKSIGLTNTNEWFSATLNGEDIDAFCNGACAVNSYFASKQMPEPKRLERIP